MRSYELLYIIPATLTDEEAGQAETEVQSLIERYGGQPKSSRRLGKFKLAYQIKHVRHGHYVLAVFDSEPVAVAKINEALRINEKVLRHLIIQAEEGGNEFNMVQYQEIIVDGSGKDQGKRRRVSKDKTVADDVKAAAELDGETSSTEEKTAPEAVADQDVSDEKITEEELDKKIDAALSESTK